MESLMAGMPDQSCCMERPVLQHGEELPSTPASSWMARSSACKDAQKARPRDLLRTMAGTPIHALDSSAFADTVKRFGAADLILPMASAASVHILLGGMQHAADQQVDPLKPAAGPLKVLNTYVQVAASSYCSTGDSMLVGLPNRSKQTPSDCWDIHRVCSGSQSKSAR